MIGLFASPQTHVAEGINESLLEGIAETLHSGGYDVFFGLSPVRSTKNVLPFWRFDGAVLMQAPKPETVAEMDLRRVPYVCVNERVGKPAAFVLADDAMGMTRHGVASDAVGPQADCLRQRPRGLFQPLQRERTIWDAFVRRAGSDRFD